MKCWLNIVAFSSFLPLMSIAEPPRQHIDETPGKFADAINAGNAAAVAAPYTADGELWPPNGEHIDGRAAIRDFWQGAIDSGMKSELIRAVEVEARGDLAGEIGRFAISVPGESGRIRIPGKYIVT